MSQTTGLKLYVKPDDAFGFFVDNRDGQLANENVLIAENADLARRIYLTESNGQPYISCYEEDAVEYEGCLRAGDLSVCLEKIYEAFLAYDPYMVSDEEIDDELDAMEHQRLEDEIYERNDEIYQAYLDFFDVITDGKARTYEMKDRSGLEESLEEVLNLLGQEHDIPIRAPMLVADENGVEEYVEFPYNLE